jgi:hypothetical protein
LAQTLTIKALHKSQNAGLVDTHGREYETNIADTKYRYDMTQLKLIGIHRNRERASRPLARQNNVPNARFRRDGGKVQMPISSSFNEIGNKSPCSVATIKICPGTVWWLESDKELYVLT